MIGQSGLYRFGASLFGDTETHLRASTRRLLHCLGGPTTTCLRVLGSAHGTHGNGQEESCITRSPRRQTALTKLFVPY